MVVIHPVVRRHRAPADHARRRSCRKGQDLRRSDRCRCRRVGEILSTDGEHDDECDGVRDPGDALVQMDDSVAEEADLFNRQINVMHKLTCTTKNGTYDQRNDSNDHDSQSSVQLV